MADIISRNPTGLTSEKIKQLARHRDIMVATMKLKIDPQVKKELKEVAAFQDKDPYIRSLKDQVTNQSSEIQDAILDGVIHCNNHKGYSSNGTAIVAHELWTCS